MSVSFRPSLKTTHQLQIARKIPLLLSPLINEALERELPRTITRKTRQLVKGIRLIQQRGKTRQ